MITLKLIKSETILILYVNQRILFQSFTTLREHMFSFSCTSTTTYPFNFFYLLEVNNESFLRYQD